MPIFVCRYSPIFTYQLLSDAVLKMKVALFRKAQDVDARSLCFAKLNRKMLCFQFIFKISRARPYLALTPLRPKHQRCFHPQALTRQGAHHDD